MTVDIRSISFKDILDAPNSVDLLKEYEEECALPELGKTNPQRDLYTVLETTGMRVLGAYVGDSLVGFATVLMYRLPHYGKLVATTESIFVAGNYRSTTAGRDLIRSVENLSVDNDCVAILYSAPNGSKFERFLKTKYRHSNTVFIRSLK